MERHQADEEDLREQQRKKLEMFDLLQEQDEQDLRQQLLQEQKEMQNNALKRKIQENKRRLLQEQRLQQSSFSNFLQESEQVARDQNSPGVAVASITIEDVDNSRDYEVSHNGIMKLARQPEESFNVAASNPEYEYEYYEADPDDIKFPVGGTKQFYESKDEPRDETINGLSNKELLMNLMQASNNFQNREFLDRLKAIVTGVEDQADTGPSVSPGQKGNANPVSIDTGHWAPGLPQSKTPRLSNNADSLPIWPANNAFLQTPSDQFQPVKTPVRFPPNRRMDAGVGEVSLVTGEERAKATGLKSFGMEPVPKESPYSSYSSGMEPVASDSPYSSYRNPPSRISDRLDTTSDQEFLVSTSMAMKGGGKALPPSNMGQGSVTVFDREPGNKGAQSFSNFGNSGSSSSSGYNSASSYGSGSSSGYGSGSSSGYGSGHNSGYSSGTATPLNGAEVFRLGSGVKLQNQPASPKVAAGANYILPTFSSNSYNLGATKRHGGQIYSDIRVEANKKNLLTVPTNPNKMYIKSESREPEAEVILYPAGQLLSNSRGPPAGRDPMIMAGSAEIPVAQDTRDQVYHLSTKLANRLDRDTELYHLDGGEAETKPTGLLQTLIRSAKDDIKFGSQVINFFQNNGR